MNITVGLIGVGKMGSALLHRLKRAEVPVRAFDIKDSALQAARDGGAETFTSSAEAAEGAEIIHVFVHSDEEVIDATLAEDGVFAGARPGTTVLIHSTIMPATTRHVAEMATPKKINVIDAAVTSVPRLVDAGRATFLVGGPQDLVETIRPHLEKLGEAVWHFGPLGTGNAAKLAKNLTNIIERVMWAETLLLAETAGIDPRQFIEMILSIDKGSMMHNWEKVIRLDNGHVLPGQANGLYRKDAQHAARLARELDLNLTVTQSAVDVTAHWLKEWNSKM